MDFAHGIKKLCSPELEIRKRIMDVHTLLMQLENEKRKREELEYSQNCNKNIQESYHQHVLTIGRLKEQIEQLRQENISLTTQESAKNNRLLELENELKKAKESEAIYKKKLKSLRKDSSIQNESTQNSAQIKGDGQKEILEAEFKQTRESLEKKIIEIEHALKVNSDNLIEKDLQIRNMSQQLEQKQILEVEFKCTEECLQKKIAEKEQENARLLLQVKEKQTLIEKHILKEINYKKKIEELEMENMSSEEEAVPKFDPKPPIDIGNDLYISSDESDSSEEADTSFEYESDGLQSNKCLEYLFKGTQNRALVSPMKDYDIDDVESDFMESKSQDVSTNSNLFNVVTLAATNNISTNGTDKKGVSVSTNTDIVNKNIGTNTITKMYKDSYTNPMKKYVTHAGTNTEIKLKDAMSITEERKYVDASTNTLKVPICDECITRSNIVEYSNKPSKLTLSDIKSHIMEYNYYLIEETNKETNNFMKAVKNDVNQEYKDRVGLVITIMNKVHQIHGRAGAKYCRNLDSDDTNFRKRKLSIESDDDNTDEPIKKKPAKKQLKRKNIYSSSESESDEESKRIKQNVVVRNDNSYESDSSDIHQITQSSDVLVREKVKTKKIAKQSLMREIFGSNKSTTDESSTRHEIVQKNKTLGKLPALDVIHKPNYTATNKRNCIAKVNKNQTPDNPVTNKEITSDCMFSASSDSDTTITQASSVLEPSVPRRNNVRLRNNQLELKNNDITKLNTVPSLALKKFQANKRSIDSTPEQINPSTIKRQTLTEPSIRSKKGPIKETKSIFVLNLNKTTIPKHTNIMSAICPKKDTLKNTKPTETLTIIEEHNGVSPIIIKKRVAHTPRIGKNGKVFSKDNSIKDGLDFESDKDKINNSLVNNLAINNIEASETNKEADEKLELEQNPIKENAEASCILDATPSIDSQTNLIDAPTPMVPFANNAIELLNNFDNLNETNKEVDAKLELEQNPIKENAEASCILDATPSIDSQINLIDAPTPMVPFANNAIELLNNFDTKEDVCNKPINNFDKELSIQSAIIEKEPNLSIDYNLKTNMLLTNDTLYFANKYFESNARNKNNIKKLPINVEDYNVTFLELNTTLFKYLMKSYSAATKKKYFPNKTYKKDTSKLNEKIFKIIETYLITPSDNPGFLDEQMFEFNKLNMEYKTILITECILNYMDNNERLKKICKSNTKNNRIVTKLANLVACLPNVINDSAIEYMLKNIVYKLFRLDTKLYVEVILFYSELFIILSYWNKDMNRLKQFIYDALYCLGNKAIPIVFQCLNFEPHLLPSITENENIIDSTIKHIVAIHTFDLQKTTSIYKILELKNLMKDTYNYQPIKSDDLLKRILEEAENNPHDDIYLAAVLLAKRESDHWTMNKMINQGLFGLIQKCFNDLINDKTVWDSKSGPTKNEQTLVLTITILASVCRTFNELNKDKVSCVIFNLQTLLNEDAVTPAVEEAIIDAFMANHRHHFDMVANILLNWKPRAITSQKIIKKITQFMYSKPINYWNKMLGKEKVK